MDAARGRVDNRDADWVRGGANCSARGSARAACTSSRLGKYAFRSPNGAVQLSPLSSSLCHLCLLPVYPRKPVAS